MKKSLKSEFLKTMTQLATAGFGFVAALAWNNAVQALIDRFIEPGSGLRSKLYYAFLVTVLAVIITFYLGKLNQNEAEKEEKKD